MTPSFPVLAAAPLLAAVLGASAGGVSFAAQSRPSTPSSTVQRSIAEHAPARPVDRPATASQTTEPQALAQHVAAARRPSARWDTPAGPGRDLGRRVEVVEHVTAADATERQRVLDYWTPRRMSRAVPIELLGGVGLRGLLAARIAPEAERAGQERARTPDRPAQEQRARARAPQARSGAAGTGSRWTGGGLINRTTGRVFLTIDRVDFVCSASTVRSANRDVVVTAGHCVKNGAGAWADNWTFVPGYQAGRRPYGTFTARRMFVAGPWAASADDSYDVGMVALNRSGGRHVADVVGTQEIAFNGGRGAEIYGFGFPTDPPFDGQHLIYCAGRVHPDPHGQTQDQGLRCDMTAGSSGGPWLSGFDPSTGRGTVTSVSSFKYSDDKGTMYGPYFGDSAKQLYTLAERS
jgi:V8-like Glu-specific endopeptidase